jgi:sulfide:quinone oxidoreductase
MLVNDYLRRQGLRDARVDMYAAEPGPMGTAGPEVSAAVRQMVESQGVSYHAEHQLHSRQDRDGRGTAPATSTPIPPP